METILHVKGEGPTFQGMSLICLDAIAIIEARMTKIGGLDFEANFEWLFMAMLAEVLYTRVDMFNDLLENHKLSGKFTPQTGSGDLLWGQCTTIEADCQWPSFQPGFHTSFG